MKKAEAELGVISLIGAVSCAVIASELWSDLTTGTEHFPLPRLVKAVALAGFCLFTILEVTKVRRRTAHVFGLF
mgnify:FL=1